MFVKLSLFAQNPFYLLIDKGISYVVVSQKIVINSGDIQKNCLEGVTMLELTAQLFALILERRKYLLTLIFIAIVVTNKVFKIATLKAVE